MEKTTNVRYSESLRRKGDRLLASTWLLRVLKRHGRIREMGSYSARLMMHGNIDIHILQERPYTKAQILRIFGNLFRKTSFTRFFVGDWYNTGIHAEFPNGCYIGLKVTLYGVSWKIDLWFLSENEQAKSEVNKLNITDVKLTDAQREAILEFKKYRNDNGLSMSSQKIYEYVINDGITGLARFKKLFKS